jgi:hypothetical protein
MYNLLFILFHAKALCAIWAVNLLYTNYHLLVNTSFFYYVVEPSLLQYIQYIYCVIYPHCYVCCNFYVINTKKT